MILRTLGLMILGAAALGGAAVYRQSVPLVFSPTQLLEVTWAHYKGAYVEQSSYRTVDTQRSNVTTSEGQSYTMLRSAWMGDKQTFDNTWSWTKEHLGRPHDHLFSWLWGKTSTSTYGVITSQSGQNTASDADTDIAFALTLAYARWQDPAYLKDARGIIQDIWNKEIVIIGGHPYLAADDLEKTETGPTALMNPSYFNPAAYRLFALVDPSHPWQDVVNTSFAVLTQSMRSQLNAKGPSVGFPPDWIAINKTTGALSSASSTQDTNFGFDAMRVPWRLALDWSWNKDPRDKALLSTMSALLSQWRTQGSLASVYSHDGRVIDNRETPARYGTAIGYFLVADPADAQSVYEKKLLMLYDPGHNSWSSPLSYYDDNWAWFGIALYNNLLPNLAIGLPASAFK